MEKPRFVIDTDKLRALREAGFGVVQIGSMLSVPPQVVLDKLMTALELSDLDPRPSAHLERSAVALRVAKGMTTQQIADELGLTKNQVRHHRIARSGELSRAKERSRPSDSPRAKRRGTHGVRRADRPSDLVGLEPDHASENDQETWSWAMNIKPVRITDLNTALESFWAKVEVTDGCWLWKAAVSSAGYGLMRVEGRVVLAHRFAYAAVRFGSPDITDPQNVLDHICHQKLCVNPSHLRSVSQSINAKNWATARSDSRLGVRGVTYNPKLDKYRVRVCVDGKRYEMGHYPSLEEADDAAQLARARLYGPGVLTQVPA